VGGKRLDVEGRIIQLFVVGAVESDHDSTPSLSPNRSNVPHGGSEIPASGRVTGTIVGKHYIRGRHRHAVVPPSGGVEIEDEGQGVAPVPGLGELRLEPFVAGGAEVRPKGGKPEEQEIRDVLVPRSGDQGWNREGRLLPGGDYDGLRPLGCHRWVEETQRCKHGRSAERGA
jgi:hypothetical protein